MARVPLVKQEVETWKMVLNVANVGLTEEQFLRLCRDNRDLRMELTAQKELVIMSPAGLKSGWREGILFFHLMDWALKDGTGIAFGPSSGYRLPNSAIRGPDASWVRKEALGDFNNPELEKFGHLCPDFVAEVVSPSDTLLETQDKMAEYMANGAQLAWLIDPYEACVYIYRPGQAVQRLGNPATMSGDPVLPGFVFNVAEIIVV